MALHAQRIDFIVIIILHTLCARVFSGWVVADCVHTVAGEVGGTVYRD